jgi:activator of HSP90 ATPase
MKKPVKMKNIKQVVTFKAPPHELYGMLMDSKKHAKFTGEKAKLTKRVGGKFTAYGDFITGKNLKLVPDKLIVQEWHMKGWPDGHVSEVKYIFTKSGKGTKLTFVHTGVPTASYKGINSGWKTSYWEPMKVALGEMKSPKKKRAM